MSTSQRFELVETSPSGEPTGNVFIGSWNDVFMRLTLLTNIDPKKLEHFRTLSQSKHQIDIAEFVGVDPDDYVKGYQDAQYRLDVMKYGPRRIRYSARLRLIS